MDDSNYKSRNLCLTIWTWSIQFIVWSSFFLLFLSQHYDNKYYKMIEKYPDYYDSYLVPYYYCNYDMSNMNIMFWFSFSIFFVSYAAYFITNLCSPSFRYLCHKKGDIKMYQKMEELFCGHPIIKFNCVCYHYEATTVFYTDSNGFSKSKTENRRVNTRYDSFIVPYHSARDISGPFVLDTDKGVLKNKDFVKLKLILIIDWTDAISLSDYEQYKADFINRNRNYDDYMDFSEERTLPGFNTFSLIKINEKTSCNVHIFWYILLTLLTFVQYYKWYVDSKCIHQSFKIIKLVSTRYNLLEQNEYTEKQPKLDLITKTYDFEYSQTGFCEEKEVDLPSLNEIKDADNKYGKKLKNYNSISENGLDSNDTLNLNNINEDYNTTITFSKKSINNESIDIKENIGK